MPQDVLFRGPDAYDFTEAQKRRLTAEYERLSDDEALDEAFLQTFKQKFMPAVPKLKPENMTYDERPAGPNPHKHLQRNFIGYQPPPGRGVDVFVYIPFDGDASVFNIAPTATNGTVATGEIFGSDLVFTLHSPPANLDIDEHVKRQIALVEWRLNHLRGSQLHLNQELDVALGWCKQARRRQIEAGQTAVKPISIPRRQPSVPSPPIPAPRPVVEAATKETMSLFGPVEDQWDVFVSHTSGDKDYVRPLVRALQDAGIKVWYDDDAIEWGDNLRGKISEGLIKSKYALVVLSKKFLAKRKWTEHELNSLFAREELGKTVILPIWHGIVRKELLEYSPDLADRMSKVSNTDDPSEIVASVLKRLGRSTSVPELPRLPQTSEKVDWPGAKGPAIAHCRYEMTSGDPPDIRMYIRVAPRRSDRFVFESSTGEESVGSRLDIANIYFAAGKALEFKGYRRTHIMGGGEYPEFAG